jgi:mono/diheme cytochrome c family protein
MTVRSRRRLAASLARVAVCLTPLVAAACSDGGGDPAAARGRQVYLAQCTQCHNADPAAAGPVGPPLKGSSRALVESKVLRGEYPPGYKPKRPTHVMPPQPGLADDIPALAAYLK